MNPRSAVGVLNDFLYSAYGEGLFAHVNTHVVQDVGPEKAVIQPNVEIGIVASKGMTIEEYFSIIDDGRYSAILYDYSLVTLECTFVKGKISRHRYFYIPCPLQHSVTHGRPEDLSIGDFFRQINADDLLNSAVSQGFIRFDYTTDPVQSEMHHPLSHVTLSSPDCRIALKAPISIAEFLTFIFDNFYPGKDKTWLEFQPFLACQSEDTIRNHETMRMHMFWADPL